MHSTTPGIASSEPTSTGPKLPVMPIAVRLDPGMGWARKPKDSIRSQTARICASVACDCITTSIAAISWQKEPTQKHYSAPAGTAQRLKTEASFRVYCIERETCKRCRNRMARERLCNSLGHLAQRFGKHQGGDAA